MFKRERKAITDATETAKQGINTTLLVSAVAIVVAVIALIVAVVK